MAVALMTTHLQKITKNGSGRITKAEVADFSLFLFYDIFEQTHCHLVKIHPCEEKKKMVARNC